MKFAIFTFDGAILSIAHRLILEGNDVYVCQISNPNALGVESWVNDKEEPECKKRRMSIYDGLVKKISLDYMLPFLNRQKNKEDFFVIFDYSNQCKIAERVLRMGYTNGLFPVTYDYEMEKDRDKAKEFAKNNYPLLKLKKSQTFNKVDDVVEFISESDKLWVIKSDGNFAETLVPDKDDLEMGKKQVIDELKENRKDFEKSAIIAEEKISNPIEFTPQLVFYDGKPIYYQVEIETRMLGCLDIGPQTGGNENLIINTSPDDKINKIAFPPIVYEEAKYRRGLYIRDAGILSDGEDYYFTEFAANRWGWGGIFTELAMSTDDNRITEYFENLKRGESPTKFKYGTSLALYSLDSDHKFPGLPSGETPINISEGYEDDFFIYQQKKVKNKNVSVGYRWFSSAPLGYVTGKGKSMEDAVDNVYDNLNHFSMKGIYYRPKSDFISTENNKCILSRVKFLINKGLITV